MARGPGIDDPNYPTWECDKCHERNSDLRVKCIFCEIGIKENNCGRYYRYGFGRYGKNG